jgi:hypothetical protein
MIFTVMIQVDACRKETEEDKVRKIVSTVQRAAEEKKILAIQEHISRSYRDPRGHDYEGIRGLLAFYFFRHKTVSVYIPSIEASVDGTQAAARFQAILTAKGVDGESASILLPDALGAYDFEVSFRKEEDKWKIVSANWERAMQEADHE